MGGGGEADGESPDTRAPSALMDTRPRALTSSGYDQNLYERFAGGAAVRVDLCVGWRDSDIYS